MCNDCEHKGSSQFHWLYHKCSVCVPTTLELSKDVGGILLTRLKPNFNLLFLRIYFTNYVFL
jgi:hypothetical protein